MEAAENLGVADKVHLEARGVAFGGVKTREDGGDDLQDEAHQQVAHFFFQRCLYAIAHKPLPRLCCFYRFHFFNKRKNLQAHSIFDLTINLDSVTPKINIDAI